MKKNLLKPIVLVLAGVWMLTISCSNEEIGTPQQNNDDHLPKEILEKVLEMKMNPADFSVLRMSALNNKGDYVVRFDDMSLTKEQFLAIPTDKDGVAKQYRSEFLINTQIVGNVDVVVYTGNPFLINNGEDEARRLTSYAKERLEDAARKWNRANSNVTIRIHESDDSSDILTDEFDISVIECNDCFNREGVENAFTAFAEFPDSAGNSGDFVVITSAINNSRSRRPMEHIFAHELGHCLGLRHTDWNGRQSCVALGLEDENTSEEPAPERILGTPSNPVNEVGQEDSIMNACFSFSTSGDLNRFDKVALRRLYPR